jgi:hypothetical protein
MSDPALVAPDTGQGCACGGADDGCGCCAGVAAETPQPIDNRPALPAIARRVGTHASFKRSMLARLSARDLPPLHGLATRDDDDFSIALLDAWATVGDVLTFYSERIANESYLRTATEKVSVAHLARLVGYEPRPGVAASADLAFAWDLVPGTPAAVAVPAGTRVQTVPEPGELPATYETVEDLAARPAWSTLRPRLARPPAATVGDSWALVQGGATRLRTGDRVLLYGSASTFQLHTVRGVQVFAAAGATRVDFAEGTPPTEPTQPDAVAQPAQTELTPAASLTETTLRAEVLAKSWSQAALLAQAEVRGWDTAELERALATLVAQPDPAPATKVFALRERASVFGHNAPHYKAVPAVMRLGQFLKVNATTDVADLPAFPTSWEGRILAQVSSKTAELDLDMVYPAAVAGSRVVLLSVSSAGVATAYTTTIDEVSEVTRAEFGISNKVTHLKLKEPIAHSFGLRDTTVYLDAEELELAPLPITREVGGAGMNAQGEQLGSSLRLDGPWLGLVAGRRVLLAGERADLPGVTAAEVLRIESSTLDGGRTVLRFQAGPVGRYVRGTVTINANLAAATHGEHRDEVLGSGDARRPFQRFLLRQGPVTHVPSAGSTGAESTLRVYVNGVLWRQVPTLYGCGPEDRVYVARGEPDGKTSVMFGDGRTGARLPTGRDNVRASFRIGIGLSGLAAPGQISLPLTRPPGLKSVRNPFPGAGAEDPEAPGTTRRNAPLGTLAVERVVSLSDYADFARAFAGVARAIATWSWTGLRNEVVVTAAGPAGAAVPAGGKLAVGLTEALVAAGDPTVPVRVVTYRSVPFRLEVRVATDADRVRSVVLDAVRAELLDRFSFARRDFGQAVALSEVMAAVQAVPGVSWVDVDVLARPGGAAVPAPVLEAGGPCATAPGTVLGAELLVVDPRSLHLGDPS